MWTSVISFLSNNRCHILKHSTINYVLGMSWASAKWFQSNWLLCAECWVLSHDDVIKLKHFPRNWPFVRRIHRSPVNSPHNGQWRGALIIHWIPDIETFKTSHIRGYLSCYPHPSADMFEINSYLYKCIIKTGKVIKNDYSRQFSYSERYLNGITRRPSV